MNDTCVQLLRDIDAWIKNLDGPKIFWLAGIQGTGKTTIALSICSRAMSDPKIVLGGSFFCSRSTGLITQRDPTCVVPTLAQLLALQSPAFGNALSGELARDPDVLHKQVGAQVEQLLYKPLLALKNSRVPIIFVIDALDECGTNGIIDDVESHRNVSEMLEALTTLVRSPVKLPIKFLVTSRPETHICNTPVSDTSLSTILRLHTINKEQVTADIRLYVAAKLSSLPKQPVRLTDKDADTLTQLSDGIFIVASTVLRYALDASTETVSLRFKTLLNTSHGNMNTGTESTLDRIYSMILADASRVEERPEMLKLLAAVLCAKMVLSVAALADIMGLPRGDLRSRLSRLRAVVHVPEDDEEPGLRTLHASFSDYLFGRALGNVQISEAVGHNILAHGCLRRIAQDDLCFNISGSCSSFGPNPEIASNRLPLSLLYACLHWAHHIDAASNGSNFDTEVGKVFQAKFLFWLEVLSILGKIGLASRLLRIASSAVCRLDLCIPSTLTPRQVNEPVVSQFLRDADTFVASSHDAISMSAPHIYLSALPFAAKDSLVYRYFTPLCTGIVYITTAGLDRHGGRLVAALAGHSDAVCSVAYSPDGRILASGSNDGTMRIWDARTGEKIMSPLTSDGSGVYSVVFAPNGERIASGMCGGAVYVWDVPTGRTVLQPMVGHSDSVRSVEFSPDGLYLASASRDTTVRLWEAETGRLREIMHGHVGGVNAITFSPDGQILASCGDDQTIRLWNAATGEPAAQPLRDHIDHIYSVTFSPDGTKLASGSKDFTIRLWETQNGKNIATLRGHAAMVRSVQFSPDGRSLVSASDDCSVRLWTLRYGGSEASSIVLGGHAAAVRSATFSSNGLYIASASDDRTIRIWHGENNLSSVRLLPGHRDQVRSIAVSSDGTFFVSGSDDQSVRVWDTRNGEVRLPPLRGHTGWVSSVAISRDGLLIASGSEDRTVRFWDAPTGQAVGKSLRGHVSFVTAVIFSPDARLLASGSLDGTVRIWDVMTGQSSNVGPLLCGGGVNAVAFSPDGHIIAAGDDSGRIRFWYAETGHQAREPLRINTMGAIEFSPDGSSIVSGGPHNASVWRISTGQRMLVLDGHTAGVRSVAYSPDGRFIGTGSNDETVRLWDAITSSPIATLYGHAGWVCSVAFTQDGQSIISGSWDKTIRVWDISTARSLSPPTAGNETTTMAAARLENGWLLGPRGELLLWVPEEYRAYLHMQPCTTLISEHRVSIVVIGGDLHVGRTWTSCWRKGARASLF